MKKIIAILLVVAVIFALSACGKLKKMESVISEIADEIEFGDDMNFDDSDEDGGKPSEPKAKGMYTISNEVLVDNEYLTVTVVEAYENDDDDFILNILIENKCDNHVQLTNSGLLSYNGYMVTSWWDKNVAPGEKVNSEMLAYSGELELIDAGVAEELIFELKAYNSDDFEEEYYIDDYFAVYPTGLDADSVTYPDRVSPPGGKVIVDNEDLKFTIESANEDDYWGYMLHLYVENRTEATIYLAWSDLSVNGFGVVPNWNDTVLSGKRKLSFTYISPGYLDANGITNVEEVEFQLVVRDLNDYYDKIYLDETFTFNP
ncbi:MAG: hypothetical protein GX222_04855 [Ruminococcaceae bacterium]|nr:hypothetical protein [Oscillospiraceae bacterium]